MTEEEKIKLVLGAKLLRLMQDENMPLDKKKDGMDYLMRVGADVNVKVYGKSLLCWARETNDRKNIEYIEKYKGISFVIPDDEEEELSKQFWTEDGDLKNVKEIKFLALCGANLGYKKEGRGIWECLERDEMSEILRDLPKGYVIGGDVNLNNKSLVRLPDFSKVVVKSDFYCEGNQLFSLKGAPKEVRGSFDCSHNMLTSLEDAPEKVGISFNCVNNLLETLNGAPEVIGWSFNCSDNKLTSLLGCPQVVRIDFDCSCNKITSLEGGPYKVGRDYNCGCNKLSSLEGAPCRIAGYFMCEGNEFTSLKGKPQEIKNNFVIEKDVLEKLEQKNSVLDKIKSEKERL